MDEMNLPPVVVLGASPLGLAIAERFAPITQTLVADRPDQLPTETCPYETHAFGAHFVIPPESIVLLAYTAEDLPARMLSLGAFLHSNRPLVLCTPGAGLNALLLRYLARVTYLRAAGFPDGPLRIGADTVAATEAAQVLAALAETADIPLAGFCSTEVAEAVP
jgi:hypothetical protein